MEEWQAAMVGAGSVSIPTLLVWAYGYGRMAERVNTLQRDVKTLREWIMGQTRLGGK